MNNRDPHQLDLFADGARAAAAAVAKRAKPLRPTEADLQAKLDAARKRLHEIVILNMKTWLPAATLQRLHDAEQWRRREVRMHFQTLKRVRDEQRRRRIVPTRAAADGAGSPR
jgi:Tfp pilus assembly protein PilN